MIEVGAMSSEFEILRARLTMDVEGGIKKEEEVMVKPEPYECAVCVSRSADTFEIFSTKTSSGTPLHVFLCKFAQGELVAGSARHVCKSCHDLINVLEQAELEYLKLKESFEAIISKNPLFDQTRQINTSVKMELAEECNPTQGYNEDSEDEPLSLTKKKRHRNVVKRKKNATQKKKPRIKNSKKENWECDPPHMGPEITLEEVKKEESVDGSESPQFINSVDTIFKIEVEEHFGNEDDDDEENSSNYQPDELSEEEGKHSDRHKPRKIKSMTAQKTRKRREKKIVHQCNQCDAKYTSLRRMELHKKKHESGKPPYICEVCGAHYKHKRACDIHVALHKGISDWKCEECNKLFPSKGALQRHNNIHTGKLNYQVQPGGARQGARRRGARARRAAAAPRHVPLRLLPRPLRPPVHAGAAHGHGAQPHAGACAAHAAQHHEQAAQGAGAAAGAAPRAYTRFAAGPQGGAQPRAARSAARPRARARARQARARDCDDDLVGRVVGRVRGGVRPARLPAMTASAPTPPRPTPRNTLTALTASIPTPRHPLTAALTVSTPTFPHPSTNSLFLFHRVFFIFT